MSEVCSLQLNETKKAFNGCGEALKDATETKVQLLTVRERGIDVASGGICGLYSTFLVGDIILRPVLPGDRRTYSARDEAQHIFPISCSC